MSALTQDELRARMLLMSDSNTEILAHYEDDIALAGAARECRLEYDTMCSQEAACFLDVIQGYLCTQKLYLYLRNRIIQIWQENCTKELTFNECISQISSPYNSDTNLIQRIFGYLDRFGYINFGVVKPVIIPIPKRKEHVVIIGAGMAGLAAARKLELYGFRVTVLEGQSRVGGRIKTFEKGDYWGDLGAMVVTGLVGNPLNIVARQVNVDFTKIRNKCPLYMENGSIVSKDKDETVEKEFNDILEGTAMMAHRSGFTKLEGRVLSLGDGVELMLKLKERSLRESQISHWRTYVTLQEKFISAMQDKLKLRKDINILLKECKEAKAKYSMLTTKKSKKLKLSVQKASTSEEAATSESSVAVHVDGKIEKENDILGSDFILRVKKVELKNCIAEHERITGFLNECQKGLNELKDLEPPEQYLSLVDRQLLDWHVANLEFSNATSIYNLSLKNWDQDDDHELSGSHLTVVGGYSKIPCEFAKGLLGLRLNANVSKISLTDSKVVIEMVSNDEIEETIEADAVLCTIPLGILKDCVNKTGTGRKGTIEFEPPLPPRKMNAINALGFGVLNKVVLCFKQFFWDNTINVFGHVNTTRESRGEFFQFWSMSANVPVLVCLIAGNAAESIELMRDDLIVGRAMGILRQLFGNLVPPIPIDSCVTRWRRDPYSRGSYSFVASEASGEDYDIVAEPVVVNENKRLFFAGEHTCRYYPATVHGAFLSGLREAGNIANEILGIPYAPIV